MVCCGRNVWIDLCVGGCSFGARPQRDQTMTDAFHLNPEFVIEDEEALRALFPPTHDLAITKCQDRLGVHAKAFIARSPFLCIGTQSADGSGDVSPRGDPCGFVKVLDDKTLLIPDRPGNNRLDTQSNIVANPAVGLLFMVPGFDETMRVNGRARLTRDPELLELLEVNGRAPTLAMVVTVDEVFIHCAKAFRRAKLWDGDAIQDRKEMPSLVKMVLDETTGAPQDPAEQEALDARLEEGYRATMY